MTDLKMYKHSPETWHQYIGDDLPRADKATFTRDDCLRMAKFWIERASELSDNEEITFIEHDFNDEME